MYVRQSLLIRILISLLLLVGILWLATWGWSTSAGPRDRAGWSTTRSELVSELSPLFWQGKAYLPTRDGPTTT